MGLAPDMVGGGDAVGDIGGGAVAGGIAIEDAMAERVDVLRHLDAVAGRGHGGERVEERFEHGEIGGRAGIAGIRREVEQDDADLALGPGAAAQADEAVDAGGERGGALRAGLHLAAVAVGGKRQSRSQPVQGSPAPAARPPKTVGWMAPSISGIATMMVFSTGSSPRPEAPHSSSVWNSSGWAAM